MNLLQADDSVAPQRVLHLSGRSDLGGGPEHILQILNAAIPGIDHFVACPAEGIYWSRYATVLHANRLCPLPCRRLSLRAFLRLRDFAHRQGIQLIHSHGTSAGVYGRMLALCLGLPVVHTFHGVPVTLSLKHAVYTLAERLLCRFTACGVAVSRGEADLVRARWRDYRSKLVVLPNGLDLNVEPQPWSEWPPRETLRIVSFTRSNNRQKHPELLIEIARTLHLIGLDFRIDAYGEGLPDLTLANEARRRGVEAQLVFHPGTNDPAAALAGAHLYLSTSRFEGLPLAAIEAWHAGLLVIATDVVGNRDLVRDGQTGFLYPCSKGRIAARLIRDLLARPMLVEAVRQRAAQEARTNHGRTKMAMRLAKLYRRVLRTAPPVINDGHSASPPAETDTWTPSLGSQIIPASP